MKEEEEMSCSQKRIRISKEPSSESGIFERLPDDLVISILIKLSSSVSSPSDFINALTVCKRFNRLGLNQSVLSKAGPKLFSIKAKNWSESVHRFLKKCVSSGSIEACYFLGMIRFYCLENRSSGASLMAKAAIRSHTPALYSLAVIQFNGSGGTKSDKDLRAGVALCARAAYLGHIDAIRELGYCFQDGYGVPKNIIEGRRLLVQANAREVGISVCSSSDSPSLSFDSQIISANSRRKSRRSGAGEQSQSQFQHHQERKRRDVTHQRFLVGPESVTGAAGLCSGFGPDGALLSDFGCESSASEKHPAHEFMTEWFESKAGSLLDRGVRVCSHSGCGRPETRPNEFRRCSVCGDVNYCSRACQVRDWKSRHKLLCTLAEQRVGRGGFVDGGGMVD